jgi:pyruvate/2-oxoglutarate/acetoin dehydrogenase E1 component
VSTYKDALSEMMKELGSRSNTIFIGQGVVDGGHGMFSTFGDVHASKKVELPVTEELQMGMTLGLAMSGHFPISCYPRMNFLLLAMNQLVNHMDTFPLMSQHNWPISAIVRVAIGSDTPMNPGHQHLGDFTRSFKAMCDHVAVHRLDTTSDVYKYYEQAMTRGGAWLLIEHSNRYGSK